MSSLYDNLNAEVYVQHFWIYALQCLFVIQIALGTVTSIEEAVQWLSYTYFFIRLNANPLVYGIRQDYKNVGYLLCNM